MGVPDQPRRIWFVFAGFVAVGVVFAFTWIGGVIALSVGLAGLLLWPVIRSRRRDRPELSREEKRERYLGVSRACALATVDYVFLLALGERSWVTVALGSYCAVAAIPWFVLEGPSVVRGLFRGRDGDVLGKGSG